MSLVKKHIRGSFAISDKPLLTEEEVRIRREWEEFCRIGRILEKQQLERMIGAEISGQYV